MQQKSRHASIFYLDNKTKPYKEHNVNDDDILLLLKVIQQLYYSNIKIINACCLSIQGLAFYMCMRAVEYGCFGRGH